MASEKESLKKGLLQNQEGRKKREECLFVKSHDGRPILCFEAEGRERQDGIS